MALNFLKGARILSILARKIVKLIYRVAYLNCVDHFRQIMARNPAIVARNFLEGARILSILARKIEKLIYRVAYLNSVDHFRQIVARNPAIVARNFLEGARILSIVARNILKGFYNLYQLYRGLQVGVLLAENNQKSDGLDKPSLPF